MITTSTLVMVGLLNLNTFAADHVWFSQTPMWWAPYIGAAMAAVMLSFTLGMYKNTRLNAAIFGAAALVFAGSLYLVRSQAPVDDEAWTKAMIPHHSTAILINSRADTSDPKSHNLAGDTIDAPRIEIAELETLIADLNVGQIAPKEIGGR